MSSELNISGIRSITVAALKRSIQSRDSNGAGAGPELLAHERTSLHKKP